MSRPRLPKPSISYLSFPKAFLLSFFVGVGLLLVSSALAMPIRQQSVITTGDVLFGSTVFVLGLFNWAVWKVGFSYSIRWLSVVIGNLFISLVLLLVGLRYSHLILTKTWYVFTDMVLIIGFVSSWCLPFLFPKIAKALANVQDNFSLILLKFGSPLALIVSVSIVSAAFGGTCVDCDGKVVLLTLLFLYGSLGLAQYSAEYLWRYRPWQKVEGE